MRSKFAIAAILLMLSCPTVFAQSVPTLRVGALTQPVRLDGRLDEPMWALADSISNLTQVEPQSGALPSARTVVKILASTDELVIGIIAYDSPDSIISYEKARDAYVGHEDHLVVILDPFLDGRSGYMFAVTPLGARYDALVSQAGEEENESWDAVWEAHTARGPWGWSAEFRIPVRSLAFREGLDAWGFNVQRSIQRLQEFDRWASPERNYAITQTSRVGRLTGLPRFGLGLGVGIRPALTAGGGHDAPGADLTTRSQASVDMTKRLGTNLLLSGTINTDFAEADVDTRRTNLTRFPLFFPEKRTFFLEGSDIFTFGLGLGESVVPFHSRRIGLLAGQTVPLDAGVKLNGRVGGTSIGGLITRTGQRDSLTNATSMGVLRVKQNVLSESSVGFIGTLGDPRARGGSWLIGPDFTYQTSRFHGDQNFLVGVWGLATGRDGLRGDRTAAGFKIDYPNDLWDVALNYRRIGESFDPSLGFVPRAGVNMASLSATWQPRPKRPIGPLRVRQCFWENELSYVTGLDGRWQSYEYFMAPINCRLESGDRFEFNIVPQGEQLSAPFEIVEGITIPAGPYHFWRYRVEAGLAEKRKFSAQVTWWLGGFYDGHMHQIELESAWRPSGFFSVELNGERDMGFMRAGDFTTDLVAAQFNANFSPDLRASSFIQYDTESESVGTNTRIRWNFSPFGTLFVVYNHNLYDGRTLRLLSNQLLIKADFLVRY